MPSGLDPAFGTWAIHRVLTGDFQAVRDGLISLCGAVPICDLSADDRGTVELVLGEVLNNIVEHAYPMAPGPIELWLGGGPAGLVCSIVDRGLAMRDGVPPDRTLPDGIDGPMEGVPEGGFGWYLIRTLTTDLHYERLHDENRLRFTLPVGVAR